MVVALALLAGALGICACGAGDGGGWYNHNNSAGDNSSGSAVGHLNSEDTAERARIVVVGYLDEAEAGDTVDGTSAGSASWDRNTKGLSMD